MRNYKKLLLIEDDPKMLRTLKRLLKRSFDVETASSLDEAEDALSKNTYSIVVSDFDLGPSTSQQLFTQFPEVKFIVFSGNPPISILPNNVLAIVQKPDFKKLLVLLKPFES